MSRSWVRFALLSAGLLPAARADFRLFVVNGTVEVPASPRYDLGTVFAGDTAQVQFRLHNTAPASAVLNYLEVRGTGFGPKNPLPLPITLAAQAAVDFTVTFSAPDPGTYSAALDSEGIAVILTAGVKTGPPLPAPHVAVSLRSRLSGQTGLVAVYFDAPAPRGGTGTVRLDFTPESAGAADPTIVFSSGTRAVAFTFDAGATEGRFDGQAAAFQTGTTAGVLTLTAQIGSASAQAIIAIGRAPVALTTLEAARSAGSLEVRLTGFDNTRTAGPVAFTFFDRAGNPIAPGPIRTDSAPAFQQYYRTSDLGGIFLIRAVFPVLGDASQVAAFEVSVGNSEGTMLSARTNF
ncbi:MAG TPA: hypothetical protein VKT49_15600 [Bryobacteraceae bacterium]|nr:hypothetical protein [Bryobacteraceae bacterium]